jgi:hypothetical protein
VAMGKEHICCAKIRISILFCIIFVKTIKNTTMKQSKNVSQMKRFHITFFLSDTQIPTLSGVTISALNMVDALSKSLNEGVKLNQIKYILEL